MLWVFRIIKHLKLSIKKRGWSMMKTKTKQKCFTKRRFTLIEMMVALGISSMIVASVVGVMVNVFWIYQDTTADFYLTQFGRIAREKMLRGENAKFGMREASWESFDNTAATVKYKTDDDTSDPYTSGNTATSLFQIENQLPANFGGIDAGDMIMADLTIEQQKIETSDDDTFYKIYKEQRGVNVYTLLKLVISGKSYLAEHKIGATIIND